jgi:hypothetical protein
MRYILSLLFVVAFCNAAVAQSPSTYDVQRECGPVYYAGKLIVEAEFGFTDDGDTLYFAGRPFYPTRKVTAQQHQKSRNPIPVTWDSKSWHALSCQADQVTKSHLDKSEGLNAFTQLYLNSGLVDPDSLKTFSNGISVFRLDVQMWTDIFYESSDSGTPPTKEELFAWWQKQFWSVVESGGLFAWGEDYHVHSPVERIEQITVGIEKMERGEELVYADVQHTALNSSEFRRDLQRKLNGQ